MTSLDEFLARKRQERNRGKLAGLTNQIRALKDLGASYKEIAEYLQIEHGLTVTRGGLQRHLKSRSSEQSAPPAFDIGSPATRLTVPPAAQPHLRPPNATQEYASASSETFTDQRRSEGDAIHTSEAPRAEVRAKYDRNSPEHLAKVAALRQTNSKSKT